jgi:hypothetical protein
MSASISIEAYSGKDSPEFLKHYKAVKFCIDNELSYPKETSEFFKGKIFGDDIEDFNNDDSLLKYIENGVQVDLPLIELSDYEYKIMVSDIPKHVDEIFVKLSY